MTSDAGCLLARNTKFTFSKKVTLGHPEKSSIWTMKMSTKPKFIWLIMRFRSSQRILARLRMQTSYRMRQWKEFWKMKLMSVLRKTSFLKSRRSSIWRWNVCLINLLVRTIIGPVLSCSGTISWLMWIRKCG